MAGSVYHKTEERPDAPDLGGGCEVAGCSNPQAVHAWSADYQEWFRYCEECADAKTREYSDLEVVEDV